MLANIIKNTLALLVALSAIAPAAGAVQLPATGQTSCFDSKGAVIPCAGTGQDGEKRAGVAWPAPRFTANPDGTVTDKLTGLAWSRHANAPDRALPNACPNAENDMSWQEALDYIKCLNSSSYLGFTDWRLPNLNELESMVNAEAADSSVWLNASGFGQPAVSKSQVRSGGYWSATSDASDNAFQSGSNAWDVDLGRGGFSFSSSKLPTDPLQDIRRVWPVRGTSTAPAQLGRTGQDACFDTAGAPTACTGTGQDGEILAGAAWPARRYSTNAGGTLAIDRLTGLVWAVDTISPGPASCPGSGLVLSWQEALDQVKCLNQNAYLGITDWRLPNRKELRSLADYSKGGPALPAGHPFINEEGNSFWSSTTDASRTGSAWFVSLYDGSVTGSDKSNLLLALPVSGPDLVAPALSINPVTAQTNLTSQTIGGTVDAGTTPVVTVSSGAVAGPVTVAGTNWSCVISGLKEGDNSITVTATDVVGNASSHSQTIKFILPDGKLSGGPVSVADALKALRIAVGIVAPTSDELLRGDVAPPGSPNGKIDISDCLLILRKAVGL